MNSNTGSNHDNTVAPNHTQHTARSTNSFSSTSETLSIEEGLDRLGLLQYLASCRSAGIENWDSLLRLSEDDFESLGISIGHRRKLQRAFAQRHDWPANRPLPTPEEIRGFNGFPFVQQIGSSGSDESLNQQQQETKVEQSIEVDLGNHAAVEGLQLRQRVSDWVQSEGGHSVS